MSTQQPQDSDRFKKQFWQDPKLMDDRANLYLGFYAQNLINRANIEEFTTKNKRIDILDLCTGTGLLAFQVYDVVKDLDVHTNIEAIDFSAPLIKFAKEKKEKLRASVLNFQEMDGQELKFENETFDFVFSNAGVCFYPDFVKGFKEIHRVMKQGSNAFINAWAYDFPMAIPIQSAQKHGTMKDTKMTFQTLSEPEKFTELLKESGFSDISTDSISHKIRVKFGEFVETFNGNPSLLDEKVLADTALAFNVKEDNDEIELNTTMIVASLTKN
ncbi:predicted protein [Naegleria gruberi]|uniref:Predicted protein n=1 Tax=Naegleria gruberi TaxID=5762 RepID=D2V733_NAEGR|nr:uncharacterized protein NAEGRDRAFT_64654 [Naegleria gruberi]EFC47188.1 predicted protein [Naegleria gruberi]|eukprot:XP_002679932.1 predicted protein [Naegleria gruberi strain NEG-M]